MVSAQSDYKAVLCAPPCPPDFKDGDGKITYKSDVERKTQLLMTKEGL
jgi:hypothetical protein